MKANVSYKAGIGGSHSDQGVYRHNPVSKRAIFHAWTGLGDAPGDSERVEDVCAKCGAQLDPWGYACTHETMDS